MLFFGDAEREACLPVGRDIRPRTVFVAVAQEAGRDSVRRSSSSVALEAARPWLAVARARATSLRLSNPSREVFKHFAPLLITKSAPLRARFGNSEREGFEPSIRFNPYSDLANRRTRPLCDLSRRCIVSQVRYLFKCFGLCDPTREKYFFMSAILSSRTS